MSPEATESRQPRLRPSGYASRLYEFVYGKRNPFYDPIVAWGFLPLGGEPACRRAFASWCRLEPGQRVLLLCCGTGSTEREMLRQVPDLEVVGVDLGAGQLAVARRKNPGVEYLQRNAADTGLEAASFDRVAVVMALHEMPQRLRHEVLSEARRLCSAEGLVVAIEHAQPATRAGRFLQSLWWGFWLPGNPEAPTSRDLARRGLETEMREAGMQIVERHTTRPDWVEGVIARPAQVTHAS